MSIKKIKIVPLILCFVVFMSQTLICYASYDGTKFPLASSDYSEQFQCGVTVSYYGTYRYCYYSLSCDSEVVIYSYVANGITRWNFMSKTPMALNSLVEIYDSAGSYVRSDSGSTGGTNKGSYYTIDTSNYGQVFDNGSNEITYNSMYVFDSEASALNYLDNGDMSGLLYNKSKKYDSENIYLENFRVIYHDSNNFDNCYIEIKYDLPEYVIDNIDYAYLCLNMQYDHEYDLLSGTKELGGLDMGGSQYYELSLYPNGISVFIKDVLLLTGPDWWNEWAKNSILGDELYFEIQDSIACVTKSSLYIDITPEIDGTCGLQNNAQIDLLNPSNTSYYSSTPDNSGNYTTNNDYQQSDGYYTTIVGQDGQGNPTYNYYYYDNSKHYSFEVGADFDTDVDTDVDVPIGGSGSSGNGVVTILWGNALQVEGSIDLTSNSGGSGSGGSGGSGGDSDVDINVGNGTPDIIIEDDDYTDTSLREDLADGFGLFDNSDTPLKADGYLNVATSFFNSIDPDLQEMLAFGISSVIVIGILRSALRR